MERKQKHSVHGNNHSNEHIKIMITCLFKNETRRNVVIT